MSEIIRRQETLLATKRVRGELARHISQMEQMAIVADEGMREVSAVAEDAAIIGASTLIRLDHIEQVAVGQGQSPLLFECIKQQFAGSVGEIVNTASSEIVRLVAQAPHNGTERSLVDRLAEWLSGDP